MKKKLFLVMVMVALLCCLFAISVSAKHEYTQLTDETLTNLDVKIILTDGTNEFDATMKFKDLFNYTLTTPTETVSYALKLSSIKATTITVGETEYTLKSSMVGIYIPDGVTHLNNSFMNQYSTVFSKAYLPDSIEVFGDGVFYKCGTFSFIDESGALDAYLPENLVQIGNNANNEGDSHFMSGCTLQNDTLVFPEGFTKFASKYAFNDGYAMKDGGVLKLVFLGKMTHVYTYHAQANSSFKFYFTKNSASEANIQAGGSSVNRVETRLVDGSWTYAYRNSITYADLSTAVDNTGKTLIININNNDPNSTSSAGTYDEKDWFYQSSRAITAYFCSGEMIMTFRNGTFGWKVYRSDVIEVDNAHPFEDNGTTVEPTCTIGGGTRYSCSICGSFIRLEDQTTDPLGHEYTEDNLVSSTTLGCLQDETKTYECQRCSEVFTVVVTEAPGHDMSIVTYPLEATYTSLGIKRLDCANCEYYTEYEYRIDPAGATMTIVLEDGTELSVLASLIFTSTFNEESQTASITGVHTSFTYGETTYAITDVHKIVVPFGFNHVAYEFSNGRDVEVYDFSLTKDLILANGAFRDNSYIEQVILGDGIMPMDDAFRASSKLVSVIIPDGVTVVFLSSQDPFYDNKTVQEFIIGKGANVDFAKTGFKGTMNSIARIVIGDGATVNFAQSAFSWLGGLKTFTIGKECHVTFGYDSFGNNQNLTSLTIGDSSTIIFNGNAFYKALKLETFTVGENCNLSFAGSSFAALTTLNELSFPDSTTITFAADNSFKDCTALETIYLPSSVTSLPKETFAGCTALKTVTLMGVTSIGEKAFALNSASDSVFTIYSHGTGNLSFGSNALSNRSNVVLYTNSTNITSLSSATYTVYVGIAHAHTPYTKDETCFENGYIGYATDCPCGKIAYGATYTVYSNEDTAGTAYTLDDIVIIDEFDGHDIVITVTYANGYDKTGLKCTVCSRECGETWESVETKPILTHKGYSYSLSGSVSGIQSGFHIELDALKEYNQYNEDLVIGLGILNPKYLGDEFFDGNVINADKGCLQINISSLDYSEISCMISFPSDNSLNSLELVIFAYVCEGEGTAPSQLIQKKYVENEASSAVSAVTRGENALHTVNLTYVKTPVAYPSKLEEYVAPQA
ncbi:MAG: leucine-rich repeat protein [Clostridia bacterium]|nr:leucine-rich repeat protein [Clostridia bacterium]